MKDLRTRHTSIAAVYILAGIGILIRTDRLTAETK